MTPTPPSLWLLTLSFLLAFSTSLYCPNHKTHTYSAPSVPSNTDVLDRMGCLLFFLAWEEGKRREG